MRHRIKKSILSRKKGPRDALMKSLLSNLITYKGIHTTEAKAKALRPVTEKLITLAKTDNLANRRQAQSMLLNESQVRDLFKNIAPKFKGRPGGYTRIIKTGWRKGDGAKTAIIELIMQ